MSTTFGHIKGKVILRAGLTAEEGKADRIASLLKAIQAISLSDKEPRCLSYRVTRSGNEFFIFEEYQDTTALQAHYETEGFKNLVNEASRESLVVGDTRIHYFEEI